ncbi:MAG: PTS sugar transporter subunit IIB [Atopobiaceae bacterium]|jgi:PTS system cellobiose-specific IIB component|nr:PTS sugar transporter subunit IIB [Atopobiaceae bacterium]MCI2173329.1 PTS sugar transporter subunit IIB [Atopobiaceae bacterium]MCI2207324.1 PTS sugar transporter subunit IIB [Atopobiaceae bacterium]
MGTKTTRVALFCSGGFSTSLLGTKLQKVYGDSGKEIEVEAHDLGSLDEVSDSVDVILLAPQVGFMYEDVTNNYPEKKVIKLSMSEFGDMTGESVAKRLMQEGIE